MGSWEELRGLLLGHRVSAAIAAAVQLGLVDLLAGQPRTADDLADAAGTDSDATGRLLRALVTVNLIAEDDGRWSRSPSSALCSARMLRSRCDPQALLQADPAVWDAWGYLAHSVRTGETGFIAKHGIDVWAHRAAQPEHNANFNALMTSLSEDGRGRRGRVVRLLPAGARRGRRRRARHAPRGGATGASAPDRHGVRPGSRRRQEPPAGLESRWSAASGRSSSRFRPPTAIS